MRFLLLLLASVSAALADPVLNIDKLAPWGKLVKTPIFLEAPERLVKSHEHPSSTICWAFNTKDVDAVKEILRDSRMAEKTWLGMFQAGRCLTLENVVGVYPTQELVLSLSQDIRNRIYKLLGKCTDNEYHTAPLVITTNTLDEWLVGANLSTRAEGLFRNLLWRDADNQYFSDVSLLMAQAQGEDEVLGIMKHMTRTQTMLVSLEVSSSDNVSALADYWARGKYRTDVVPVLASLATKTQSKSIDITHLLPPNVRSLIYAYPDMSQGLNGRFPDCHWTSLNFAEEAIHQYYIDTTAAAKELTTAYTISKEPLRLGDVLLFRDGGNGLHSCVYIADDIVFSKNGSNLLHPWVFSTYHAIVQTYHEIPNLVVEVYRKKG